MPRSTGFLCRAGFVLLATTVGCALSNPALWNATAGTGTGILQLMSQAEQIVHQDYPNALFIEALGEPSAGSANAAEEVDTWQFRFVDDITAADPGTVLLDYVNEAFGTLEYLNQGLVGTVYERLPRVMSLTTAIGKLRGAGYADPFTDLVLRKPLTNPEPAEAFYIFTLPGRFVFVGMLSGEVTEEVS